MSSARTRAQRLGCALVRFEPGSAGGAAVAHTGSRQVRPRQYQHTLTLRLDGDEQSLWRSVNGGHRSRINGAQKRGLRIERSSDPALMPEFVNLLRQTERRNSFFSFEDDYFTAIAEELLPSGEATLYFAAAGDRWVAGARVRLRPDPLLRVRCHRQLRGQADAGAATGVASHRRRPRARPGAIRLLGGGAPMAGPDHPGKGITDFKRGFGGEPESNAGTWELPVRPLAAALLGLARRLRR
jgi:hypothetical protein